MVFLFSYFSEHLFQLSYFAAQQILGSGMSNRMWENTVEHAKTCVLGGKLFVYYTGETSDAGVVFNDIYELRGLIADGQFFSLESLTPNQKVTFSALYDADTIDHFDVLRVAYL